VPGRALLDTSVIVEMLRGEVGVAARIRDLDEVFTSVVVIGELLYGARRSATRKPTWRGSLNSHRRSLPCPQNA
jgi:predicted nucleic acid-binding protein